MSPGAATDLVLLLIALLTLLFAPPLVAVIRLSVSAGGRLDKGAATARDEWIEEFENELREDADARAKRRTQKELGKKDVRAEYRGRRKRPWAVEKIISFGGITISVAGLAFALPSWPQFPPLSQGAAQFLGGSGAAVATCAVFKDGSKEIRDWLERRRKRKSRTVCHVRGEEPAM